MCVGGGGGGGGVVVQIDSYIGHGPGGTLNRYPYHRLGD